MGNSARVNLGRVVRGGERYEGKQGLDYTPGISADSVGSRALWVGSVTLPPNGGRTKAHLHEDHESAFYMISGDEAELWSGEQLEHREVARPGDYVYIPAGVPHVAVNRSEVPAGLGGAPADPPPAGGGARRPAVGEGVAQRQAYCPPGGVQLAPGVHASFGGGRCV